MKIKKASITLRDENKTIRIEAPIRVDHLEVFLNSLEDMLDGQLKDGIIIESIYFYEEVSL